MNEEKGKEKSEGFLKRARLSVLTKKGGWSRKYWFSYSLSPYTLSTLIVSRSSSFILFYFLACVYSGSKSDGDLLLSCYFC